ncbi:hypothetical protein [Limnohabitans planktonicus]|uniref:Uncharacterized protein n=1 Tax=Limnohabitans planktonicus II-D5 TaxID=1293045 RepID=A0A2T7UDU0_9BURK|nr:hypothetical protein [Limnohabitans planktonicus]PVE42865.1 hypothetical protein H663_010175 [Limnohabitans planktonicus II-D5]|eukprot:gene26793-32374_t
MGVLLAIIGVIVAGGVILSVLGMIFALKLAAFVVAGVIFLLFLLSAVLGEALGISGQVLFFFCFLPLAVLFLVRWLKQQKELEQARQREAELAAKAAQAAAEAARQAQEESKRLRRLQPLSKRFDPLRRWLVEKLKD